MKRTQMIYHPIGLLTGKGGDEGRIANAVITLRGNEERYVQRELVERYSVEKWPEMGNPSEAISRYIRRPGIRTFTCVEDPVSGAITYYHDDLPKTKRRVRRKS